MVIVAGDVCPPALLFGLNVQRVISFIVSDHGGTACRLHLAANQPEGSIGAKQFKEQPESRKMEFYACIALLTRRLKEPGYGLEAFNLGAVLRDP